jgi:glutamate-1-semialdehyde 2,1-aminomutase
MAPSPPYATKGEGAYVIDSSGHRVLDANNNYTALIHGHNNHAIRTAVEEQLQYGTSFGLPTQTEVELAEVLKVRTGQERWRFSNSGTEAVMTAIRAARAWTGRSKIVRFEGSYHGTSDAVVDPNALGITPGTKSEVIVLPQGDTTALKNVMEAHQEEIAAVLIDLMPNRAGLEPAQTTFVESLQELTERTGALLIVDEVITLRISVGGLAGEYGLKPDLITAGKIIGGGFPIGAVGGREDVLSVFDPLSNSSIGWGGTFSANPISMTAGKVALENFDHTQIDRLNTQGDHLRGLLKDAGISVSGKGSLIRLREELSSQEVWWTAYQHGLLLGTNGLIALSTAMTDQDICEIGEICTTAIREVRSQV